MTLNDRRCKQIIVVGMSNMMIFSLTALNFTRKFQGHEYALTDRGRNWADSRDTCAAAGATLAVLTSPEEDEFARIQYGEHTR